MRRFLLTLAVLALAASTLYAENIFVAFDDVDQSKASQTAQIYRFERVTKSLLICNDDTTNEAFYVLYSDQDNLDGSVAAAAVTDAYIGAGKCHSWNWSEGGAWQGTGYLTISVICSTGETATVRVYGN